MKITKFDHLSLAELKNTQSLARPTINQDR
jgi:hypothetical protein